ncbi:MAG: NAD(P)H-dependent glycerol-3-phosphate dehydrogenase [Cytophagaceae bacterium]|nr:NAD(P)H-dependent glycerol-3-phosphate dehydrogenase [Cytophagaceae bacterium]MDW8457347.1 NAD(P)H-dependent glycerol-3-phosphate dehydrogenase [Cytophagaceae bacterium]
MQKNNELPKVAVLGGGSWATALVKILSDHALRIHWWLKNESDVMHLKQYGNNPRYLSNVQINTRKVKPSVHLHKVIEDASIIVLAVPSAFIADVLKNISKDAFKNKIIVSAVKGMIPEHDSLVTDYLQRVFDLPHSSLCVISGPCHSEEIAMEKRSYLTIAGENAEHTSRVAEMFSTRYVKACTNADLRGIEYCAVMKNIIAIACGVARGLNYGDNFQAVLVSNAMAEIEHFLSIVHPAQRNLLASAYLGDLLVTAYSPYSRNRTLGYLVGKGYSVRAAQAEMNMVAEGYYAVACVERLNKRHDLNMPITKAVYNILYEKISPIMELRILEEYLR